MENIRVVRWVMWVIAAFFYFYEFLLRVSPSVMVPELMQSFSANAVTLGVLTSFYYYAYAPMQLPVGFLMDRYGAKKLLIFASCVCGGGSIFFALTNSISLAALGRFFIGIGSSFAFVAMVYICSHMFEFKRRAFLVGLANSIGMLGAIFGQGPLSVMVEHVHWRSTMNILGMVGIGLAIAIFFLIKKDSNELKKFDAAKETPSKLLEGFKFIIKSPYCWLNAVIALLFYMTTTAIGDLWGISFIQTAYGVSKDTAGFATSMLFTGWLIGGPIVGHFSDRTGKRKPLLGLSIVLTLLTLLPCIYLTDMPIHLVYIFMFCVGFFSSAELLNFTFSTELVDEKYKGSAIAFTNCLISLGSSLIQPVIGSIMDYSSKGTKNILAHRYSAYDYKLALTILPVMLLLAIMLCFFLKENKRQVNF